ncbi:hypothetical protein CYJ10_29315 [Cupriavidus pauculus]|uniref:Uncharacterized protein n=1 Tax=Cupriavidus pauculus TaxID=82633 RepID=A0A2N5C400_9BURK|nr:hypothetical protein CYJ10_29315 [Cupriavidus pauculus]
MAQLAALMKTGTSWRAIGAHLHRTKDAAQMKAAELKLGPKPYTGNKSPVWSLIVKIGQDKQPRSVHELVKMTRATRVCIDRLMKERHEAGLAHVGDWLRSRRGPPKPLWVPFPGKDAPKPYVATPSERACARMRRMKEEDPLRYKAIIARCSLRRRLKKGLGAKQHAVVQALFGMGVSV